ncbi:response regulator transcription factor [Oceanobacillus profundus]|uniref:DNA-binding response regulator n=1 Tax=Oceanobacillus profundus TaxID=372463 RepID=A0A417YHY4_9BACI|nr:response regulator transcription factor [Oceanobacillus profundus]MBR3118060.1 response regulator transcription factor [Oceanobacillus sp.]PAE28422.1 DNA-binding response regulator [Paenibacillus sp. 7884-2]MCM3398914.1 response regulator transcription factor [Oceanobacillus profundus]MDO6451638.1 response regulator transcription factor [Oceanobacillus profundus]RHW32495.1 DNA-binding response regulator [Oceanobacillus profundus]
MVEQSKILIVEDDYEIARIMRDHLNREGFQVTWASTGLEGLEDFRADDYSLVLVDLMMPEMDGFTLCETIRLESDVPLLIVSAKNEDESKIRGLGLGADDYLTKPFSLKELTARVHSHLRRYERYTKKHYNEQIFHYKHGLAIDFLNEAVFLDGKILFLTTKEREILFLLAKNPFITFEKVKIYEHVWQLMNVDGNNTVTVHIKSLRTKLKDTGKQARFVQTVWGVGYRFIGEQVG